MALQDNDGGGSSSGDLESLRGKPSMFFFFFGLKIKLFIANCLILFTEIQFLLLMWLQNLVNWPTGSASK